MNERRISEDRSSRSSDVAEGDTTLVNNDKGATQGLLVTLQAGQTAIVDKNSDSLGNAAITELREVKALLLDHEARVSRADEAKDIEILELKRLLKEERSRRELADSKAAVLESQADNQKKRLDKNDEDWRTPLLAEVTSTSSQIKAIQAAETEAQQELIVLREELSKQGEILSSIKAEVSCSGCTGADLSAMPQARLQGSGTMTIFCYRRRWRHFTRPSLSVWTTSPMSVLAVPMLTGRKR